MLSRHFDFLLRGEKHILEQILSELAVSIEASKHVLELVKAFKAHDYKSVIKETETISDLEKKVDKIHLEAVERICTGSYFGGIREDFLNLAEKIDAIADGAKDCSKIFWQRQIPDSTCDYLFKENVTGFIEACIDATKMFSDAILALNRSKSQVIKLAAQVEEIEEKADAIRAKILANLLRNEVGANTLDIIMLKDFLDIADDIADYAEDGSDVLLMLVAKGFA